MKDKLESVTLAIMKAWQVLNLEVFDTMVT